MLGGARVAASLRTRGAPAAAGANRAGANRAADANRAGTPFRGPGAAAGPADTACRARLTDTTIQTDPTVCPTVRPTVCPTPRMESQTRANRGEEEEEPHLGELHLGEVPHQIVTCQVLRPHRVMTCQVLWVGPPHLGTPHLGTERGLGDARTASKNSPNRTNRLRPFCEARPSRNRGTSVKIG